MNNDKNLFKDMGKKLIKYQDEHILWGFIF